MKTFKNILFVIAISFSVTSNAQHDETSSETAINTKTYYENRAKEDAQFEQQFNAKTRAEEEDFWKEQKDYESNLKQRDKKAYKAYLKGKKETYAKHYNHCDSHCHHSDYYYHHASFYYSRYDAYYYERHPKRRSSYNTHVRISTPTVRLGLF